MNRKEIRAKEFKELERVVDDNKKVFKKIEKDENFDGAFVSVSTDMKNIEIACAGDIRDVLFLLITTAESIANDVYGDEVDGDFEEVLNLVNLHSRVRHRVKEMYGDDFVSKLRDTQVYMSILNDLAQEDGIWINNQNFSKN